jgi:hypothetical protein
MMPRMRAKSVDGTALTCRTMGPRNAVYGRGLITTATWPAVTLTPPVSIWPL